MYSTHTNAHYEGWNSKITHVLLEHPEKTIEI